MLILRCCLDLGLFILLIFSLKAMQLTSTPSKESSHVEVKVLENHALADNLLTAVLDFLRSPKVCKS